MPAKGSNLLVFVLVALRGNYGNFRWIDKGAGIFVLICWNRRNKDWSLDYLKIFQDYAESCLKRGSERSNPRQRFLSALDKSKHLRRIYDSAKFPRNHRVYQIKEESLGEYNEKVYRRFNLQSTVKKFASDSNPLIDHVDHDYAMMSSPSIHASQYSDDNMSPRSSPFPSFSSDSELSASPVDSSVDAHLPFLNFGSSPESPYDTVFEHPTSPSIDLKSGDCHRLVPCSISEEFSEEKFYELCENVPKDVEDSSDFLAPSKNERDFNLSSTSDLDMEDFMELYGVLNKNQSNINDHCFDEENKQKNVGEQSFICKTQPHETHDVPGLLNDNINIVQANPAPGIATAMQQPVYYIINIMCLKGLQNSAIVIQDPKPDSLNLKENLERESSNLQEKRI